MDRRRLSGKLQRAGGEPDRVAGEGRGTTAAGGYRNRVGNKRLRAQRELAIDLAQRPGMPRAARGAFPVSFASFLKFLLLAAVLLAAAPAFTAETILASRVW